MPGFKDSLLGRVKQGFCRIIGNLDSGIRLLQRKVAGDEYDDLNLGAGLNRLLCDNPTPPTPPDPPFRGGQCCDVVYTATINYTACGRQGGVGTECQFGQEPYTGTVVADVLGKIEGVFYGPKFNGVNNSIQYNRTTCTGQTELGTLFNVGGSDILLSFSASFARKDGQPDTCGDPTPRLPEPPPNWNRDDGPMDYTDNDGNNINVPVGLLFGYADIDINGEVNIPVTIDVGGINLNADINISTGDINIFPDNNYFGDRLPGSRPRDILPSPDNPPPPPPLPDSPLPTPPTDEESERGERVIVGALVTTTLNSSGRISTLFQDINPDIKIPSLGHISFLCRVGDTKGGWTKDIPVKNHNEIIQCPWEWGAVDVQGTPQPGVDWVITPLYSRKKAPREFPVPVT